MALKIQLFGDFRVWRKGDTEPIGRQEWGDHKCMQVLKILVSERGQALSQGQLIERLWPHCDPTKAAASLRNRVSRLRRVLEPDLKRGSDSRYVRTSYGGYRFQPESECEIDSERFAQIYQDGQALKQAGQWHEAVDHYERAAALYRGDYLAEDRYESWALAYQEHWRRAYLELLARLADCYAHLKQYQEAIARLEQAIELAPTWSERIYQQLMDYYMRLGECAGMTRTYARLQRMLMESFAAEPSPETQAFYAEIRRGRAELRAHG